MVNNACFYLIQFALNDYAQFVRNSFTQIALNNFMQFVHNPFMQIACN